jgi:hypothetical protein
MKKVLAAAAVATVASGLAVLPATGAVAAPKPAPPKVCVDLGLLGSGEEALFSKMGGCASSVATGGLETGVITRAGYVQQCQLIRSRYGWGTFTFDYPFLALLPLPSDGDWTLSSLPDCAETLQIIHDGVKNLPQPE